jgi:hypothetical protein
MKKLRPPLDAYTHVEYKYYQDGTEAKTTFIADGKIANAYLDLADRASTRVQSLEAVFLGAGFFLVKYYDAILESIDSVALKIVLFVVAATGMAVLYYFISKYTRSQAVCSRMASIYSGQGPSKLNDPYE